MRNAGEHGERGGQQGGRGQGKTPGKRGRSGEDVLEKDGKISCPFRRAHF